MYYCIERAGLKIIEIEIYYSLKFCSREIEKFVRDKFDDSK